MQRVKRKRAPSTNRKKRVSTEEMAIRWQEITSIIAISPTSTAEIAELMELDHQVTYYTLCSMRLAGLVRVSGEERHPRNNKVCYLWDLA